MYVYCTVDGQDSDPHQLEKSDPDPLPKMERIRNTGGNMMRSILRLLRLFNIKIINIKIIKIIKIKIINIKIIKIINI